MYSYRFIIFTACLPGHAENQEKYSLVFLKNARKRAENYAKRLDLAKFAGHFARHFVQIEYHKKPVEMNSNTKNVAPP